MNTLDAFPGLSGELKELRQWVIWRYEPRPGKDKPAKAPYQPRTGHRARTDVPATWGTYPQALARFQQGGWHGLGFVFTADDPYAGIDLDDCRNPLTRGAYQGDTYPSKVVVFTGLSVTGYVPDLADCRQQP